MNRGALALLVLSVALGALALGLVAGTLVGRAGWRTGWHGPGSWRRHGPAGPSARIVVPRLGAELGLSPAQQDSVRADIERTRSEFQAVRESLRARIERHLTAEQRARWRELLRERHPGETGGPWARPNRDDPGEGKNPR